MCKILLLSNPKVVIRVLLLRLSITVTKVLTHNQHPIQLGKANLLWVILQVKFSTKSSFIISNLIFNYLQQTYGYQIGPVER